MYYAVALPTKNILTCWHSPLVTFHGNVTQCDACHLRTRLCHFVYENLSLELKKTRPQLAGIICQICGSEINTKMASLGAVVGKFYSEYTTRTPKKLKVIDAYLFYILLTGIVQFVYCCFVGTFPFNSFLSGFISTVSCFILAGELPGHILL